MSFQAVSKAILDARMETKIEPKSSARAFQHALGAGSPLEAILASMWLIFGALEPLKIVLSL